MLDYLLEVRRRALYSIGCFGILFAGLFCVSEQLFALTIKPLVSMLASSPGLISTTVTGPIFIKISLAANFAMLLTIPFVLYQIWVFIYPALHEKELQSYKLLIMLSMLLFALGVIFGYFCVLPMTFKFLLGANFADVTLVPDINYAISFIMRTLLVFGVCFELPLLIFVLVSTGLLSYPRLISFRPYFIVLSFVLGMLLTPPDVFSQIMLAVPMVALFEISLCFVRKKLV